MDTRTVLDLCFNTSKPQNSCSISSSSSSNSSCSSLLIWDSSDSDSDFLVEENSIKRVRREGFMEHTVPAYTDEEYKYHFRLERPVVKYIELLIGPAFENSMVGRPCIDSNISLHLFLWYIGNQESFRQVCHRFNVSESTAHRLVNKVSKKIASLLSSFIVFPAKDELDDISNRFRSSKGIVRVIGVMGVSHILIKKPKINSEDYFNKKAAYSIITQGVCDVTGKFIDIHVGAPGSLSHSKVLRKSDLYQSMTREPARLNNYCILGGAGYPLLNWLIAPFKSTTCSLSSGELHFNTLHSKSSEIIDNAFKLVLQRFRRLKDFENSDLDFICQCILSACILHNICLQMDDNGQCFLEDYSEEDNS